MNKKTLKALQDINAGQAKKRQLADMLLGRATGEVDAIETQREEKRLNQWKKRFGLSGYHPEQALIARSLSDLTHGATRVHILMPKTYTERLMHAITPESTQFIKQLLAVPDTIIDVKEPHRHNHYTFLWNENISIDEPECIYKSLPEQKYKIVYDKTNFKKHKPRLPDFMMGIHSGAKSSMPLDEIGKPFDPTGYQFFDPSELTRFCEQEFFKLMDGEIGTKAEIDQVWHDLSHIIKIAKKHGDSAYAQMMAPLYADRMSIFKTYQNSKNHGALLLVLNDRLNRGKYRINFKYLFNTLSNDLIFHPQFDDIYEAVKSNLDIINEYGPDYLQSVIDKVTQRNMIEAHELPELDVDMS